VNELEVDRKWKFHFPLSAETESWPKVT